jgi:hypothetical protein
MTCPNDYPWLRDGRCWPSHYYDNLGIYGPSIDEDAPESVITAPQSDVRAEKAR